MHPVADLHCDLLAYLTRREGATLQDVEEIGAALPHLLAGNVCFQTLAIFTLTEAGSTKWGEQQVDQLVKLRYETALHPVQKAVTFEKLSQREGKIGVVAAIENASGFCEEDEPLKLAFSRLEHWIDRVGPILYLSLTHHAENRFGGGNHSETGLKKDGKALLEWLDGRHICVDLSHTSDALAEGIFDYLQQYGLEVPVIASHSNFRPLCDHKRNLPKELAQEVIQRGGLIGINFLRDYVDPKRPEALFDHIRYGWEELKAEKQLAFGADFFALRGIPDPERQPLFFPQHANANRYPVLLQQLADQGVSDERLSGLAYRNVQRFLEELWVE